MEYILFISLLLTLSSILYQDVRERQVNWILFPIVFILSGVYSSQLIPFKELLVHLGINILILGVLLITLAGYIFLRFKNKSVRLWHYLGVGDVLFFIVLAICFSPFNFVLFALASLLFALLLSLFFLSRKSTVPLAGFQAVCLMCVLLGQRLFAFNPFNEIWIYQWI